MSRIILHCDLNSFYASVELLSHPELKDVPAAVCGDPASRHGIILAKNDPAKKYGVQTAETIWLARKKCPNLILLPPHHERYHEYSRKVNVIYDEYTELVETFGIDENWLDITHTLHLFGGAAQKILRKYGMETIGQMAACKRETLETIMGKLGTVYVENNHPAIISRDTFYQAKAEMARRASKRKVMQKTGKTEQGKYSSKYALTELLICGECGTPYKRCTWAKNGKKRIVWRCVSRLEFGTKYCHDSPTLDEDMLHRAVVAALNEYGAIRAEVKAGVLELAEVARSSAVDGGVSLLELKRRLDALTAEQALLLDEILKDMDNPELNDRLQALAEEKRDLLAQTRALEEDESQKELREARRREMEEWLDRQPLCLIEYDDALARRFVERITVADAETIQVKIRNVDVVIERKLC